MDASIGRLEEFREAIDKAYGPTADATKVMRVGGEGSLADIIVFAREGV